MTINTLSILMVLIGAAVLFLSISPAIKICRNLIDRVRRKWVIILYLMGFFIFGYLSFDIILICNLPFPLELVTGGVFLGGAVFVFIVMNVSLGTITALQKAEEAIHVAKDDWESTFDAVTDMITVHDMDFNIIRANPAARAIFELQQHKGISLGKCFRCYHGTETPPLGCVSCQSLQTGKPSAFEAFEPHLNKHLEIRAMPRFGNDGRLVGLIHVVRDITERKQAEEEKICFESRLQQSQKMEAIGSLAGGIAHDLNNILFPIIGFSEMLLAKIPPDNHAHKSIEQIYKSAQRGSDLVKQILAFSRQSNLQKLPIRIQPILKEVLMLVRATIPMQIEITNHLEPDCGKVFADPTQIHQIAMNLIINAYHAVEGNGGTIDIALKEAAKGSFDEQDDLHDISMPEALLAGKYACLSVSDTGTGIEQSLMDKIFDPYFTTKEQGKGTGLGLSVVHGIVKEHGGDIRVFSEIGKGTVFHVYLPLVKDAKDSKTAAVTRKYHPTGCESILLVDDEELNMRMEQMMLEGLGYLVTARTSSLDALDAFRAYPAKFDLVISDRSMPNMTGEQLARELISIRPGIPIIICTGFSDENDEQDARAMGVKGFLMKPITIGDFATMVRKVLDETNRTLVHEHFP